MRISDAQVPWRHGQVRSILAERLAVCQDLDGQSGLAPQAVNAVESQATDMEKRRDDTLLKLRAPKDQNDHVQGD